MATQTPTKTNCFTDIDDRKIYKAKVKAQLDKIDASIDKFKAEIAKKEAEGRIEFNDTLAELKSNRDAVAKKLEELQDSTDAAWNDVRQGFEKAWENLDKSFRKATSHF